MTRDLLIQSLCVETDALLKTQLDTLLHHPLFQQLESGWRGLDFITQGNSEESTPPVLVKCFSLSMGEFNKDLENIDQSHLFTRIYSQEFDQAGGTAFGLMLIDFSIKQDEIRLLSEIAKIASLSFCLVLLAAEPSLLGFEDHEELSRTRFNKLYSKIKLSPDWLSLRRNPDARFLGISTGRILIRPQYNEQSTQNISYLESNTHPCWLAHHYVYAAVILKSFKEHGWFHDLNRSFENKSERGKFVDQDESINDRYSMLQEAYYLSTKGFITALDNPWKNQLKFYFHPHIYKARSLKKDDSEFSQQIPETLCVARIAHTLKILLRNKLSLLNDKNCEQFLQNWIQNYCAKDNPNSNEINLKFPLEEARLKIIKSDDTKAYQCTLELKLKNFPKSSNPTIILKNRVGK